VTARTDALKHLLQLPSIQEAHRELVAHNGGNLRYETGGGGREVALDAARIITAKRGVDLIVVTPKISHSITDEILGPECMTRTHLLSPQRVARIHPSDARPTEYLLLITDTAIPKNERTHTHVGLKHLYAKARYTITTYHWYSLARLPTMPNFLWQHSGPIIMGRDEITSQFTNLLR